MTFFHTAKHFFIYKLLEINEYSIHSPFLYRFYNEAIKAARHKPALEAVEALRRSLKKDDRRIVMNNLGAPSRIKGKKASRLSAITRKGLTRIKYAKILHSLADYFQCRNIVELGTSMGLTTLYLAAAGSVKKVWTFEGNEPLANIAEENFKRMNARKIQLIRGNIEQTLPSLLKKMAPIDLIFIDANHTFSATTTWYDLIKPGLPEGAIVIFDDIYWSEEMTRAWEKICRENDKNLCLDLFQLGIIIHGEDIPSGYYRLSC